MGRAAKVAITLDEELLARAEELRRRTGESRSALLARALRELLGSEGHRRRVERYVEAYREHPETEDEIELARTQSRRVLEQLDWDEE